MLFVRSAAPAAIPEKNLTLILQIQIETLRTSSSVDFALSQIAKLTPLNSKVPILDKGSSSMVNLHTI